MSPTASVPFKMCRRKESCVHPDGPNLPATLDYFYAHSTTKDGLNTLCRECAKAETRNRALSNPEEKRARDRDYYQRNSDIIRERSRKYYWDDPESKREYSRHWYAENAERAQETNRQWVADNPDKVRAVKQAYVERDPERRRKQAREYNHRHPEKIKANRKRYYAEHPEANRQHKVQRRARKHNAPGRHTTGELRELRLQQDGRCGYCGIPITFGKLGDAHLEHMTPLHRGGSNSIDNLVYSCLDCNLSKHRKTFDEWAAWRGW